jgi:hypothetical protein
LVSDAGLPNELTVAAKSMAPLGGYTALPKRRAPSYEKD